MNIYVSQRKLIMIIRKVPESWSCSCINELLYWQFPGASIQTVFWFSLHTITIFVFSHFSTCSWDN